MSENFRILAIPGSLRRRSFNLWLVEAVRDLAPENMEVEIFRLDQVPLFDADLEERGDPYPVQDLKRKVMEADALVLATPEYNHSLSGVMKNAIDWLSRPPNPLKHKPVALMGATPGVTGTARAQTAVRTCLAHGQAFVLPGPETLVSRAPEKFDEQGHLTDATTKKIIQAELDALYDLALHVDDDLRRELKVDQPA